MRLLRFATAAKLALMGTALAVDPGHAASLPMRSGFLAPGLQVTPVGEREAAAAGAIVGGAVGVLLGSALGQRAAPPPPPPHVIVEEEPAEERVIIERWRPARRVVEIEDDAAAPQIVDEEECVTRRTRVYDPDSGETIVRKERTCR